MISKKIKELLMNNAFGVNCNGHSVSIACAQKQGEPIFLDFKAKNDKELLKNVYISWLDFDSTHNMCRYHYTDQNEFRKVKNTSEYLKSLTRLIFEEGGVTL